MINFTVCLLVIDIAAGNKEMQAKSLLGTIVLVEAF